MKMETTNTLNFTQDKIPKSNASTTSSLSSSISEKSVLSESSNCSFSSVSSDDHFSRELSASLQDLISQSEQREDWSYDLSINLHVNTAIIGNDETSYLSTQQFLEQPPPPPLEIEVAPSDDRILSTEELDAIFESFAAAADGYDNYSTISWENEDHTFEKTAQSLQSFSII